MLLANLPKTLQYKYIHKNATKWLFRKCNRIGILKERSGCVSPCSLPQFLFKNVFYLDLCV